MNYLSRIDKIKKEFPVIQNENFTPASDGTHYKVFLSNRYVIRFRDDNAGILSREANFLKHLNHQLIPKVLWTGKVDKSIAMVENRLPGKTINTAWKTLSKTGKANIIKQVVHFLKYLKIQTREYVYSVNTGKKYDNFSEYLADGINQKIGRINKFKQTRKTLNNLIAIIKQPETKRLFLNTEKTTLVHGDFIIHNLLTDGRNLTGVLDWELASLGDPDYDLFRLFYYQECAKAYQKQGVDESFEADYMNKLIAAIFKSDLIKNKKIFQEKYQFARAIFHLNALHWAANSDDPDKNIDELIGQWNKNNERNACMFKISF